MRFEVILPVYHGDDPDHFEQAVDSVMCNTLRPTKLIVVQDGPVPQPLKQRVINLQNSSGTDLLVMPENKGLAAALNHALSYVKEPYVMRADADDVNSPDRFEGLAAGLRAGYDLVGSYVREIDPISGEKIAIKRVPLNQEDILKSIPKRNPFNHMSVGYKTDSVLKAGGYPAQPLREDYALWALMARSGATMMNFPECWVSARTGLDMYRRRGGVQYIRDEIKFQSFLISVGSTSWLKATAFGSARCAVFALPPGMRGFIYENALRRSSDRGGENEK